MFQEYILCFSCLNEVLKKIQVKKLMACLLTIDTVSAKVFK